MFQKKITRKEFNKFCEVIALQQLIVYNALDVLNKQSYVAYNGDIFVGSVKDLILNTPKILNKQY